VEGYARDGLTDDLISAKLGVNPDTFYQYQKRHPEFAEALRKGKEPVDQKVESALLKRALGYDYDETHTEARKSANGKEQIISVKKIQKHMAADVAACIIWLKNRRRSKWKDRWADTLPEGGDPNAKPKTLAYDPSKRMTSEKPSDTESTSH